MNPEIFDGIMEFSLHLVTFHNLHMIQEFITTVSGKHTNRDFTNKNQSCVYIHGASEREKLLC